MDVRIERLRARFDRADLSKARLAGACLVGAHFDEALLTDADLSRSELTGAFFTGAELSGAQLVEALAQIQNPTVSQAQPVAAGSTNRPKSYRAEFAGPVDLGEPGLFGYLFVRGQQVIVPVWSMKPRSSHWKALS